nr:MAG: 16S rRNA (guanine(966)-N(2))-methyltransferase RsmD [Pseudomonadota bacterium]
MIRERRSKRPPRAVAAGRGARSRVLRIIGGTWRGRRLRFPPLPEIRPTPDRVRETLFNWLGTRIVGARCLDLFAGSGALGLEALSRGAARVVFVEREPAAVRELRTRLAEWGASGARVEQTDALRFVGGPGEAFDVVFLDPPFGTDLLGRAAERLETHGWLAPGALIYVEAPAREPLPALPATWRPLKAKKAGEVGYHLFERT